MVFLLPSTVDKATLETHPGPPVGPTHWVKRKEREGEGRQRERGREMYAIILCISWAAEQLICMFTCNTHTIQMYNSFWTNRVHYTLPTKAQIRISLPDTPARINHPREVGWLWNGERILAIFPSLFFSKHPSYPTSLWTCIAKGYSSSAKACSIILQFRTLRSPLAPLETNLHYAMASLPTQDQLLGWTFDIRSEDSVAASATWEHSIWCTDW